jgi:hypothetical protein
LIVLSREFQLALVRPLISGFKHLALLFNLSVHLLRSQLDLTEGLDDTTGNDFKLFIIFFKFL